ncbi:uncharacterized protein ATNIH1004_002330 [Aspergillus tanneri]|uniref:Autophagy-related protein 16 domain-containing protein n=1 Tax=Aspergillus tanneri TaxID=1220188 RepID=A0A5M9MYC6_9EURO|nr:uncharacterized protein ATNIH1004_002330 [Aspergillus tanneri]KAA8649659.1 hypothetical protein ATNIH1004_002330 [Aspergillus tanneri]
MTQDQDSHIRQWIQDVWISTGKLLEREENSRRRQEDLEFRIREDQAANKRALDHCAYLETVVTELEKKRLQHESSLNHLNEQQWVLHQDLIQERTKVKELEGRVESQYSVNEALLRAITQTESNDFSPLNLQQILLENERQRELISTLQSTLNAREATVRYLQMAFHETSQDRCSDCSWGSDTESFLSESGTSLSHESRNSRDGSTTPPANSQKSGV